MLLRSALRLNVEAKCECLQVFEATGKLTAFCSLHGWVKIKAALSRISNVCALVPSDGGIKNDIVANMHSFSIATYYKVTLNMHVYAQFMCMNVRTVHCV